jgi:hypothetical protein
MLTKAARPIGWRLLTTLLCAVVALTQSPAAQAQCPGGDVCSNTGVQTQHFELFGNEIARHHFEVQVCRNSPGTLITQMNILRNYVQGVGIGRLDWSTTHDHRGAVNVSATSITAHACMGVNIGGVTAYGYGSEIRCHFSISPDRRINFTSDARKFNVAPHHQCP